MSERERNEIIQLYLGGASCRAIARVLGVTRYRVKKVIASFQEARARGGVSPELPSPPRRRRSLLDQYEGFIRETLEHYPDITAVRLLEKLQAAGFRGGYTIVRQRLKELRPRPRIEVVTRFETAPGMQAQMDYSTYTIDFVREGRRRVHAFSYVLGYSRRQYVHFVEAQDFTTTIRQHVRAFHHLGGAAAVCLYDNMKVVVSGFIGEAPIYNPRFVAFATHYGFRPWACRPGRPRTKGKVERPFSYLEKNLLNGRRFDSLEDLNRVTSWWLRRRADLRVHRHSGCRPIDRWREERPLLRPLPEHDYDTAEVIYRSVDVEGYVSYRNNRYSVPWRLIGELLPLRVTESELVVYTRDIVECARHELFPRTVARQERTVPEHRPRAEKGVTLDLLRQRFEALGALAVRFLERLVEARRYGKKDAARILSLLEDYRAADLTAALERALRYGAFSYQAVERILGFQARPRPFLDALAAEARSEARDLVGEERIEPRATSQYQDLLDPPSDNGELDGQNTDGEDPGGEDPDETTREGGRSEAP